MASVNHAPRSSFQTCLDPRPGSIAGAPAPPQCELPHSLSWISLLSTDPSERRPARTTNPDFSVTHRRIAGPLETSTLASLVSRAHPAQLRRHPEGSKNSLHGPMHLWCRSAARSARRNRVEAAGEEIRTRANFPVLVRAADPQREARSGNRSRSDTGGTATRASPSWSSPWGQASEKGTGYVSKG